MMEYWTAGKLMLRNANGSRLTVSVDSTTAASVDRKHRHRKSDRGKATRWEL